MAAKYANLKIPETLAKQADAVLETGGYTSRSAFAKDAIRRRIEELRKIHRMPDPAKLTSEEEEKLFSWTTNTNLKGAEEFDIQRMLQENQHIKDWKGILRKLPEAVAYVLELKKN